MEPEHRNLIATWAGASLATDLESVLADPAHLASRLGWEFKTDLYPLLRELDSRIPGVGMHFVVWNGSTPLFPFPGRRFDGVLRTLRYIPYYLASQAAPQMMARSVAYFSGAHVEQCMKTLNRRNKDPLGGFVRKRPVRKRLGEELAKAIETYGPSWNRAKHEFETGTPESVIPIHNAIGSYFAARILGTEVLTAVGHLERVVELASAAARNSNYYITGSLPEPPNVRGPLFRAEQRGV